MYIIHLSAVPVLGSYHCYVRCYESEHDRRGGLNEPLNSHWTIPPGLPFDLPAIDHLAIVAESMMGQIAHYSGEDLASRTIGLARENLSSKVQQLL